MRVLVPWKLKCYVGVCTEGDSREVAGRTVHVGGRWEGEGPARCCPRGMGGGAGNVCGRWGDQRVWMLPSISVGAGEPGWSVAVR